MSNIIRPKFQASQIDYNSEKMQKFIKRFCDWARMPIDDEEMHEEIAECFQEIENNGLHQLDGYNLAKMLDENYCVDANSHLVNILDECNNIAFHFYNEYLKQWVKENNLVIPEDIRCKTVIKPEKHAGLIINNINHEKYTVTLGKSLEFGGYIVNFELVQISE
jgi:hypothetical protein